MPWIEVQRLWNQRASHDEVLAAVEAAAAFGELVEAIIEVGGQEQ